MQPRRTQGLALLFAATWVAAALAAGGHEDGSAHATVSCTSCHDRATAFASADTGASAAYPDPRIDRCLGCHGDMATPGKAGAVFHEHADRSCLRCHAFHEPATLRVKDHTFVVAGALDHCSACHEPGADLARLDAGHRAAAAAVYHGDHYDLAALSPSEACLLCHERGQPQVPLPAEVPPAPRFHAESSHVCGIPVVAGRGAGPRRIRDDIDPRLVLPRGRLECNTCHRLTGGAPSLLVPFDDPYALCLGCHQVRQLDPLTVAATR